FCGLGNRIAVHHLVSLASSAFPVHCMDLSRGLRPGRLVYAARDGPRWNHDWPADGSLLCGACACELDAAGPRTSRAALPGWGCLARRRFPWFCDRLCTRPLAPARTWCIASFLDLFARTPGFAFA